MAADVIPVADGGLGDTTWLVDLCDGRALAVDATRDLRAVHEAAQARGLTIAFAADTHLHPDFLTGAVDLARSGATPTFAAGHMHGAVSIPLRDVFATWLGWTTDPPDAANVELGALAEGAPADVGPATPSCAGTASAR